MARVSVRRYPAMAASASLHAAVLAAFLIAWPWLNKPLHMGDVVPVTIMTSADLPQAAPAEQAPTPAPAATDQPTPQAPPQPSPQEQAPPAPTPPAKKAETPPPPKPAKTAPAKPAPQPQPDVDWTKLAASLSHQTKASPPKPSSAPRGPTHLEQAVEARTTTGVSDAAASAALSSLSGELERLWNPNCEAQNASGVVIKVTFHLSAAGRLVGTPVSSQAQASDPAVKAASDRAVRAVYEGEPAFANLPPSLLGQAVTVNFDPKSFCSNR